MGFNESVVTFSVNADRLYGILHSPPGAVSTRGVLIVVGGPQTRVGSHRQFVLLARFLAAEGIPVLRFDYRGMGDSEGEHRTFEHIDDDMRAAIDTFFERTPGLEDVVIWGLCDAASAAAFYAKTDRRVSGLVLLNPWVRTEAGIAKAYLKHYYISRVFNRELWQKVFSGKFDFMASLRSLLGMITSLAGRRVVPENQHTSIVQADPQETLEPLPARMYSGLAAFPGPLLFILSGDDLTADEFRDVVGASRQWRRLFKQPRVCLRELAAANHTFSRAEWRDTAAQWTLDWLRTSQETSDESRPG